VHEVNNPFELVTASKLDARQAVDLWCDDKRLDRVNGLENCFVNGHRGTGKSMLFRVLQHDCQKLLHPDHEPEFVAVYFSVRDTEFLSEELELFQSDSQRSIISESHLSLLIVKQLFLLLKKDHEIVSAPHRDGLVELTAQCCQIAFRYSAVPIPAFDMTSYGTFLNRAVSLLEEERVRVVSYIGLRLYERFPFDGPLFLFDTLLGPIGDYFRETLKKNLYILIDDGDDLPESHTVVLNSWIARRRASVVFKVSTMFGYKTYETRSRSAIQHPHDFFQFDIATRYMSDASENYVGLLHAICTKRLKSAGIETSPGRVDPDEFFPEDADQRQRLQELAMVLTREYEKKYEGRAVRDYVYRHLTSEYLQRLSERRSTDSFVYSGFKTLAVLSSGLVRDFILCAQRMFDNAARGHVTSVTQIPASVQNAVVRQHADLVLEEILNSKQKRARDSKREEWQAIHRLIEGLGTLFKDKILSKDAERRVFSFAFQTEPGIYIERLLGLAVAEGYLMRGFISRKEGTGRRTLYVLTRRLAPAFSLDVSAYSGYLSLTAATVLELIKHGGSRPESVRDNPEQLRLLPDTELLDDGTSSGADAAGTYVFISPEEAGR
jgi:hypothetical protein